ncbi:hypothetical protein, partial [Sinorhizobium meliloti]|uniref:hypothetical protein n=1 Tax=Rhizobium meliloti TaxID=382 RepID=UPI001F320EDB
IYSSRPPSQRRTPRIDLPQQNNRLFAKCDSPAHKGEMAGRPEGVERKTLHAAEDEFAARIPCGIPKMRSYDFVM